MPIHKFSTTKESTAATKQVQVSNVSSSKDTENVGSKQTTSLYGEAGSIIEDETLSFTKRVTNSDGTEKFYLRKSGKKLFNPRINSVSDTTSSKNKNPKWKFKEVSQKAFDYYMDFLNTGNDYGFKQAQMDVN